MIIHFLDHWAQPQMRSCFGQWNNLLSEQQRSCRLQRWIDSGSTDHSIAICSFKRSIIGLPPVQTLECPHKTIKSQLTPQITYWSQHFVPVSFFTCFGFATTNPQPAKPLACFGLGATGPRRAPCAMMNYPELTPSLSLRPRARRCLWLHLFRIAGLYIIKAVGECSSTQCKSGPPKSQTFKSRDAICSVR